MSMRLSQRALGIGESATLAVSRRAAALRAAGVELADFSAGEPDFPTPSMVVDEGVRALRAGMTRYAPTPGLPGLRRALAEDYRRRYGAPWSDQQVIVGVGAKSPLFGLALALLDPGDEMILPSPYWVSFPEQIRFAGGVPVTVGTVAEEGFRIRAAPIVAAMGPATRGVLINSPCNPTGGVVAAEDLETLAAACAERGIVLISDETYEHLVFDGEHASVAVLASRYPDTVVAVGSFSKSYAMTGWRVGYALGPPALIKSLISIQSHSTSSPATFAMAAAQTALREAGGEMAAMREEYRQRRDLVLDLLASMPGVECVPPAGSFYAFPRVDQHYRGDRRGSVALAEYLLEEARVAVVPGVAFGDDNHIRISFACSRETLREGLGRMARALSG
jgi:aspartate aminotransferase